MKSNYFLSVLMGLGLIIVLASCKGSTDTKDESSTDTSTTTEEGSPSVQLNNGSKWPADQGTTLGIGDMKNAITTFDTLLDGEDLEIGIRDFEVAYKQTYNSTALTGEAKAQFINYMKLMQPHIANLRSTDVTTRQNAVTRIKDHLTSYNDFFM